jgi:AmiR/NasT family two-component response regulator
VIDAALRHIYAHLEGEDLDEEGLEHLGCAIAELMMASHYMRHRPDLDDRVSETQR